ncbi:MAG TPA: hypothetical protein VLL76_11165, partial [Candidatus Omnitrophota bacterium]|nr:hypothetical protein [Candidatus Omnitrophota bacterium]
GDHQGGDVLAADLDAARLAAQPPTLESAVAHLSITGTTLHGPVDPACPPDCEARLGHHSASGPVRAAVACPLTTAKGRYGWLCEGTEAAKVAACDDGLRPRKGDVIYSDPVEG